MRNKYAWTFLLMTAAGAVLCSSFAAEVREDFERGTAGWVSYREGDGVAFSLSAEQSYAGEHSLLVETPGENRIEGVRRTFTVEERRRYRVSVMAKGEGRVRLAVSTPRGWVYGTSAVLKDEWQELELSVFAYIPQITASVYTMEAIKGVFYLDDLTIKKEPLPVLPEEAVEGVKFEAEDYPPPLRIAKDASASGGAYREGTRWHYMADAIPYPQTALPVYIYVRAWIENHESNYLEIRHTGAGRQPLSNVRLSGSGQWEWVKAGPFVPGEITGTFSVRHGGAPDKRARVDCIVASTRYNLEPSVLDGLHPVVTPGRASVKAGRAARAPFIDGKLDDEAWMNAVELTPFLRVGETEFAHDGTKAYICYDDEHLYVAFHNSQFALEPANNILHEFRRETGENNDDAIWRDDYAVILISPDGKNTYDIFMNAAGALNDARGTGHDPWSDRYKGWNSGAKTAAGIYDGYWVLEAAVPFSSLGGAPSEGDRWRIGLGRRSQQKNERSSWVPLSAGFHMPEEFGELVFGAQVPGIRNTHPGDLREGTNTVTAEAAHLRGKTALRLSSSVAGEDGAAEVSFTDHVVSEPGSLAHDYRIETEGRVSVNYSIMNAADFGVFYRSPDYTAMIHSSFLEMENTQGRDYRVYLNGREIADRAPLYPGINILAVETAGEFSCVFRVGEHVFSTGGGWRYSGAPGSGWNDSGYDDSGWETAQFPEGIIGKKGEKRYYRRRLLFGYSRFWPNWEEQGIWIAGGSVQQLFHVPQGVEGLQLGDYSLILEVPEEFNVPGASGYYDRMKVSFEEQGASTRNGRNYRIFRAVMEDNVSYRKWQEIPSHHFCAIAVSLPPGKLPPGEKTTFYYYLSAGGGAVAEVPRPLRVNILPDVQGKQPRQYMWYISGGWLSRMDDKVLQRRVLAGLPGYGFNAIAFGDPMPEGIPLMNLRMIDFNSWNLDMRPYLEKNPGHALLDNEGLRRHVPGDGRRNHVCTTRLLEDSRTREFVKEAVRGFIERARPAVIDWDYESNVWSSYISCYCGLCLDRFRESSGIPEDETIDPDIIRDKHGVQWTDFMCRRMAMLAEKFNGMIKEVDPDIVFTVYSGYQSERTRVGYGVDWRYLAGKIDKARAGYGRPVKELADTLKALGGTPLVVGAILYPYRPTELRYPSYISEATFLRRAVEGTGGVLVYTLATCDGRTFYASGEISRLVADFESVFAANNRKDELASVTGMGGEDAAVLVKGNTRIVMLINESGSDRKVTLVNREFAKGMTLLDYYESRVIEGGAELETLVPANGVKVFIVTGP